MMTQKVMAVSQSEETTLKAALKEYSKNPPELTISKLSEQEAIQKQKEDDRDKIVKQLRVDANPNCHKCHGLGHRGIINHYTPYICNCVLKKRSDLDRAHAIAAEEARKVKEELAKKELERIREETAVKEIQKVLEKEKGELVNE